MTSRSKTSQLLWSQMRDPCTTRLQVQIIIGGFTDAESGTLVQFLHAPRWASPTNVLGQPSFSFHELCISLDDSFVHRSCKVSCATCNPPAIGPLLLGFRCIHHLRAGPRLVDDQSCTLHLSPTIMAEPCPASLLTVRERGRERVRVCLYWTDQGGLL